MAAEPRPPVRLVSRSAEATERVGERLGRALGPGAVLALSGELGAGKTALVRGLARGLGVEERVSSPTYTLLHEYEGRLRLYHYDAWMEGRERALLAGGGSSWLFDAGVAVVEWAERVADLLPEPRLEVRLAHRGPEERELVLERRGSGSDGAERALDAALAAVEALVAQDPELEASA